MKRKRSNIKPTSDQHRRFLDTARQLGADEDKERFEEKLRQIAGQRSKPHYSDLPLAKSTPRKK